MTGVLPSRMPARKWPRPPSQAMLARVPTRLLVLGVDPGPDPGLFGLDIDCAARTIVEVRPGLPLTVLRSGDVLAVEAFMPSRTRGDGQSVAARADTVHMIGDLRARAVDRGWRWWSQPAGVVKPWATDERLREWGLWRHTVGHRHTRDAARMALFAAVRLGLLPPSPS